MQSFIICGIILLWLLALLVSSLKLEGDTRKRVQYWIRVLFLMMLPVANVLVVYDIIPAPFAQISFPFFMFGCAVVVLGAFLTTDFTVYMKERTAEAAKGAVISAVITLAFMVFAIFLLAVNDRIMQILAH